MAVPVPITLALADPPPDWKATSPDQFSELLDLIAGSLSGLMDNLMLSGQVGGSQPTGNVGPWANGTEWWFYDNSSHGYQPSEQGLPVGTVVPWGGLANANFPYSKYLICAGQAISRTQYSRLFSRIGTTWGNGDGSNTFNLPPSGKFYLNAAGLVLNPAVPLDSDNTVTQPGTPGAKGGAQISQILTAATLPSLKITVPYLNPSILDGGGVDIPNITSPGANVYNYPVTDEKGNLVGTGQQAFSIMPPFVLLNFMIKFL